LRSGLFLLLRAITVAQDTRERQMGLPLLSLCFVFDASPKIKRPSTS
jgi:hypothetical protein